MSIGDIEKSTPIGVLFSMPLTGLEPVQYRYRGILSYKAVSEHTGTLQNQLECTALILELIIPKLVDIFDRALNFNTNHRNSKTIPFRSLRVPKTSPRGMVEGCTTESGYASACSH